MHFLRALVVWVVMMAGESCLAVLRIVLLVPIVGDFRACQAGFFVGTALILGVACLFVRWVGVKTPLQRLAVGLEWATLTLLFEVGVGRLAIGLSGERLWARMREDYDVLGGRLDGVRARYSGPLAVVGFGAP